MQVSARHRVMEWSLPVAVNARMSGTRITEYFYEFRIKVNTRDELDALWINRYGLLEEFVGHTVTILWDDDDELAFSIEISIEPTDGKNPS